MKNRIWSLLMVIGLAWIPTTAAAQNADMSEAKKHFKSGQAFMQMERWGAAVEEFKKAYEITKDGLVMGQVALAYEKGQDYEAALAAMKVYHAALGEGERASAEAMIKKYEKLIADGRSKKLVLPSEEAAKVEAAQAEAAKKDEVASSEDEGDGKRTHRLYTWIAAGAAGALALSALVVGLNAQSKFDELSDTCKPTCPQSDVDSVKTRALVTDVLWGVAAAAAVTSVVLYFLEGRSLRKEDKLDPGEGADEEEYVQRRIHVAPMMGGGTYGVGANISF